MNVFLQGKDNLKCVIGMAIIILSHTIQNCDMYMTRFVRLTINSTIKAAYFLAQCLALFEKLLHKETSHQCYNENIIPQSQWS